MLKRIFILALLALVLTLPSFVSAQPEASNPNSHSSEVSAPPEVSGLYDVTERPGMKVRVFVHPARNEHPQKPGTPVSDVSSLLVCGLTDPSSDSVVGKAGWRIPNGSWTYMLNLGSVPLSVGSGNLDTIVKAGFDQYTSASGNKITFLRGANTSVNRSRLDGKNIISWGRTSSGTLGVTYIWYYPSTGLAVEIDTIMNNRYKWSWSQLPNCADSATYDAQNIMTHELGHWLGLDDQYASNFTNNTMFGYGSLGEVKKNTLTSGDIAGVVAIYP